MKTISRKLILVLCLAFAGQTALASGNQSRTAYFAHSLRASLSSLLNKVTSYKPSFFQAVAGVCATCGLGYCLYKLKELLSPAIDDELLEPVDENSAYMLKPQNANCAFELLCGSNENKEDAKPIKTSSACKDDKTIAVHCLKDPEVKNYLKRQENLSKFSRVGAVDISQVSDMSDADKAALQKAQQEAATILLDLIKSDEPKILLPRNKQTTNNQREQLLYNLAMVHGRIRAAFEARMFLNTKKNQPQLQPNPALIQQAHDWYSGRFNQTKSLFFGISFKKAENNTLPESWCPEQLAKRVQTISADYMKCFSQARNQNHQSVCALGLRHGYTLGLIEACTREYGVQA